MRQASYNGSPSSGVQPNSGNSVNPKNITDQAYSGRGTDTKTSCGGKSCVLRIRCDPSPRPWPLTVSPSHVPGVEKERALSSVYTSGLRKSSQGLGLTLALPSMFLGFRRSSDILRSWGDPGERKPCLIRPALNTTWFFTFSNGCHQVSSCPCGRTVLFSRRTERSWHTRP